MDECMACALSAGSLPQVYNCLWSHAGGVPVHIHYVVQPVTKAQMDDVGVYGPVLQVAMFDAAVALDPADIDRICDRARKLFGAS
jgi:hypothetical protein